MSRKGRALDAMSEQMGALCRRLDPQDRALLEQLERTRSELAALVLAGAESQLMSLWQVDDAATKELMVEYYKRLQAGEGRAEALRQVQLRMLKSTDWSHPYFWASFIPLGQWAGMND